MRSGARTRRPRNRVSRRTGRRCPRRHDHLAGPSPITASQPINLTRLSTAPTGADLSRSPPSGRPAGACPWPLRTGAHRSTSQHRPGRRPRHTLHDDEVVVSAFGVTDSFPQILGAPAYASCGRSVYAKGGPFCRSRLMCSCQRSRQSRRRVDNGTDPKELNDSLLNSTVHGTDAFLRSVSGVGMFPKASWAT